MDYLSDLLNELKRTKYKIFIWGGAVLAKKISDFLEKNNVPFAGFLINKCYKKEDSLYEKPVYELESYINNNECSVIVGFGGYDDSKLESLNHNNIKKIYIYDFAGALVLDEYNVWTKDFVFQNTNKLNEIKSLLSDEKSQKALDDFIYQRTTGCYSKPYSIEPQYFDSNIVHFCENEVFVDCGAFHGETSIDFMNSLKKQNVSSFKQIVAFEPDGDNVRYIERNLLKNVDNKLKIINAAVGKSKGCLTFSEGKSDQSRIDINGNKKVAVTTIDEVCKKDKVTFIKMDIEGAELLALQGAEETIKKDHPKLAISVYHRPNDLFTIWNFINSISSDYKFYFRNYQSSGVDSVLYAI